MKLFSLDQNGSKVDYNNITNNPFIGETDKVIESIDTIIELNGNYYTVGWIAQDGIGVHLIHDPSPIERGEYDTIYDEHIIVCPVCGYRDNESFEVTESGYYACGKCSSLLNVEVECRPTYTTTVVEVSKIIKG